MRTQNSKIKYFLFFVLFLGFGFWVLRFPKAAEAAASLSLSPATQTVEVNQTYNVGVMLNTGGSNTDAADVIINYDATKLTLETAALGDLYDNKLVTNTSVSGKVTLRASSSAGRYYNGSGTFATLTFKGKAVGSASVTFDFTANSTTDSNVAYAGSDILGSVSNATYTVVAAGTLPTAAPTFGPSCTTTPSQPVTGGITPTVTMSIFGTFFLILGAIAILF